MALSVYLKINEKIVNYNESVEKINDLIQKKKLTAGGGNLYSEEKELDKLHNAKVRHEVKIKILCDEYQQLLLDRKGLEKQKKDAKNSLDEYTKDVFEKYQKSINEYLGKIGAGFEIAETQTSYVGGRPSSSYCIKINEVSVKLGDTKTYGQPCFRNILSQGDKNSLAFAFFLARLNQDENLSNRIVIFDDPISSLDSHRKDFTKTEILNIADRSNQCVVMSHDKYFLRSIFDNEKTAEIKSLSINRGPNGSLIKEWDIENDTMNSYFKDFYKMLHYINNGVEESELRSIARCIRPVLEGYFRIKYPKYFKENEWLGDLIKKIDQDITTGSNTLNFTAVRFSELKNINDYSKKYHHKFNQSADSEAISDDELKPFIERTIKIIEN